MNVQFTEEERKKEIGQSDFFMQQLNMVKIHSIGDIQHLFAFDSIMGLLLIWPGERTQRTK